MTRSDSLEMYMREAATAWDPDKEPWTDLTFRLAQIDLTVTYSQQVIHPFLAEYNRNIQFSTDQYRSDKFEMLVNNGGRTLIEVYLDTASHILIFEDTFGRYRYDLNSHHFSQKLFEETPYPNKVHLGTINGKEHPLRYLPKE